MSPRHRKWIRLGAALATAGAATGIALWYTLAVRPYQLPTATADVARHQSTETSGAIRDEQIAVWHQALAADTGSALVLSQLAALHAQRARESGSFDDYRTAEQYARHSLARRTHRNGAAAATLVAVLLAQHRFADAMGIADTLVQREPDVPVYRAIRGEVALELGQYDTARVAFTSIWSLRTQPAIAPRVARWLELTGRIAEARQLLQRAQRELASRRDVPAETQAWFALRVGDLEWRGGHPRAAARSYRAGLVRRPDDPRLLTAMARLATQQGRAREAQQWAERAVAAQADATTLLALARAREAAGDVAQAREVAAAVATLVAGSASVHRDWWLWQLDHRQQVAEIRARAMAELSTRADVYGYDLVAWALHREGRHADARAMMRKALALGTIDPQLQAHAEALE